MTTSHRSFLIVSFCPLNEFGERSVVCIDHKQVFDASAQDSIDADFAIRDAKYRAGACVNGVVFEAGAIAEDNNDLVFAFRANDWFEALDPVSQGLHIRL
jgi:hypothetical protein